jgi:rsbT co-antagonist protein RsbR
MQTIEAAQMMGVSVALTGIAPEIAQALVALGVDLSAIDTVGDLQGRRKSREVARLHRYPKQDRRKGRFA